jgi:MYXO-CTERM domain-containing protein
VGEGNLGRANPDHGQVTPMGNLIYIGNDHGTGSAFFCHQMGQDTTPLSPDTFYPEDGSTSVSTEARVSIVFSDFVDMETVSKDTVSIRPAGGEPLDGVYTYQFNHLSFSPDVPFVADTTYEVSIASGGVMDVMGNGLAEDVVVHFSTGSTVTVPDIVPPGTGGATMVGVGGSSDPIGTGGGFEPPTGGATGNGGAFGLTGGSSGVGTGGGGTGGAPVVGEPSGGGPASPGNSSSNSDASSDAGGCAMNPNQDASGRFLAFGLLGALFAFARRKRRWL